MKFLLKLFLSLALTLPALAYAWLWSNSEPEDHKKRFCLSHLQDAIRQCEGGFFNDANRNMHAFYNQCVVNNGYTLDEHSETRARANTCWVNSVQSFGGYSGARSVIFRYFPNDLN